MATIFFSGLAQNLDLCPVFWMFRFFEECFDCAQHLSKILLSFRFFPKFWFLRKISIFPKILIFTPNFDFYQKFWFLSKILIFTHNFDITPKVRCLPKILSFTHNFDITPKVRCLPKILIFMRIFI